jgi:perosamine synthetase
MVNSGSNSLYIAVKILGLEPGSEVILPSFTWIACAQAVLLCGCVPVFCDVDLDTHNVTAETIRPHLTARTGAIMIVHYAGKPVDMAPILDLGVPVIEDAAHAVDSRWRGVSCGAIADVGIYSFDAIKNLASPEGGGITVRDPERFERARSLRYCGIEKSGFAASATSKRWWEYAIRDVAPKLLSNDVCAAVALAQLESLDANQDRRRRIWDAYQSELRDLVWLVRPVDAGPDERHSYFTYCVRLPYPGARDRLAEYLYERGIYTTLRYHPLHLNAIYQSSAVLPVSEQLNEQALSLPIHPRISDQDLDRILTALREFPV